MVSISKAAGVGFLALFAFGMILAYYGYVESVYTLDKANGFLNRAETAGFAEEMIEYMKKAHVFLPKEGNPVWLFPTEKTDFKLINFDLESIVKRAEILTTMNRSSDAYQQGMDDLRGKLMTLQGQIRDAAPYLYVSWSNTVAGLIWLSALAGLGFLARRGRRRRLERVEESEELGEV